MREMYARAFKGLTEYSVVLGPCPGCDSWQLDYTHEVERQYVRVVSRVEKIEEYELGSADPIVVEVPVIDTDMSEWHGLIEAILQEHVDECPHLRDLVEHYV